MVEKAGWAWGRLVLEQLLQDLRLGLKRLRKNPGFAAVAILTLALGVGANTAILSLVYSVAFKPLPVGHPDQLYSVGDNVAGGELTGIQQDFSVFSYRLYQEVRDHTREFSTLAAFSTTPIHVSVRRGGSVNMPRGYAAEFVSGNYFHTFEISAFAGRILNPDDDRIGAAPSVVMSYHAFSQSFGSDRSLVGETIFVNGRAMTLAGIAPAGFFGETLRSDPPDFWLPLSSEPLLSGESARLNRPDTYWLYAIGRLASGTNLRQAEAHVTAEVQRWYADEESLPGNVRPEIAKVRVALTSAAAGIGSLERSYGAGLRLMLIFSGLVLLISCANVSNLLLARAAASSSQTALRVAIGASRSRLIRQFLTEGIIVAMLGGAVGTFLALAGTRALLGLAFHGAGYVPIASQPSLVVLAITLVISLANGFLFSAAPAWTASRTQPSEALSSGGRSIGESSGMVRNGFVTVQAALSIILLVGAGLLTKSLDRLRFQQFGFESSHRFVVNLDPSLASYTPSQLHGLYQRLEGELSSIPGVASVSFSFIGPMSGAQWVNAIRVREHPGAATPGESTEAAVHNNVSARYFETLGMHLLRGRLFDEHDNSQSRPVAIVTQTFAQKFFAAGENPIGKHVDRGELSFSGNYEIVGVVEDAKYASPWETAQPTMFVPLLQMAPYSNPSDQRFQYQENYIHSIQLRVRNWTPDLEMRVRQTLAGINANLAVLSFLTLDEQVDRALNASRLLARITVLYGLLSLVLASVGLYGVSAFNVTRRTNEIGIRMALGANRQQVFTMIVRSALLPIGAGLLTGIAIITLAKSVVASQLYNVSPSDPLIVIGAALVLMLCAFVAAIVPAIRAAAVSPSSALRR
jgi:predicted permease